MLAVALSLYTEVTVEEADHLSITSEGEGSELPADMTHLAARVAAKIVGHDRLAINVRSDIPVGRGLGSSASLAVAAAAAAGAADPLKEAAAVDGHPENAAASVLGGLVAATTVNGAPVAVELALDPELRFVVLVPNRPLATHRAREALPAQVPHADAAFNLGRLGLLIAGLADHRMLLRDATDDRLHQTARTPLFPESSHLMAGLVEAGALAACWSGAGPSLLGICTAEASSRVQTAGEQLLKDTGVPGRALLLEADHGGVVTG
ncbi:MAG: homoserine kinase [Actinomycetota bacterium]|nr:homoserine kinase [Actinomycetota bacterium]